jgi:IS1 family transposase
MQITVNGKTHMWGKRDLKTVQTLKERIRRPGIRCERMAADDWDRRLFGGVRGQP